MRHRDPASRSSGEPGVRVGAPVRCDELLRGGRRDRRRRRARAGARAEALAREGTTVAVVWLTGVLKLLWAAVGYALAHRWRQAKRRRMVHAAGWTRGLVLVACAVANLVQHALLHAGAVDTPAALGPSAVTRHLAVWDPFWLLRGILFRVATWRSRRAHPHA